MSFVSMKNIHKEFKTDGNSSAVQVLSDINLEIKEGEFIALMGPSGSGKSTLLTVLGVMSKPSKGEVLIDGINVYDLNEEKQSDFRREYLGFVFQQHHLMPYLTAIENVMLPLVTTNYSIKEKQTCAMSVLDKVGLADKSKRYPNQLSGGEQGRLAIARALVNNPPVILADEPTGALDTKTGSEIMRLFTELNAQGQTIFMVTHDINNAGFAHRVVYIQDGHLTPMVKQGALNYFLTRSAGYRRKPLIL
jgi:putative ABC transport system ATP-binding protein